LIVIKAGSRSRRARTVITAADPVPDDLREALTKINNIRRGAH